MDDSCNDHFFLARGMGEESLKALLQGPIYQPAIVGVPNTATEGENNLTLLLLEGKHIAFEGVPGSGKTTFMHLFADLLQQRTTFNVVRHYEERDDAMLNEFFRDPARNAFWFQMVKLLKRKNLCERIDAAALPHEIHLLDRTLPGDLSFALYNYDKGVFTDDQMRTYLAELSKLAYRPPFLTILLDSTPARLVERIARRGNVDEKRLYTEEDFVRRKKCQLLALEMVGCRYCIIDWNEDIDDMDALRAKTLRAITAALNAHYKSAMGQLRGPSETVLQDGAGALLTQSVSIDSRLTHLRRGLGLGA